MCHLLPYWFRESFVPNSLFEESIEEGDEDPQTAEVDEVDDFHEMAHGFLKSQHVRKIDVLCTLTAVLIGIALVASSIALIIITSNVYGTGAMTMTIYIMLGITGFAGSIMTLLASKRIYELLSKWASQQSRRPAIE